MGFWVRKLLGGERRDFDKDVLIFDAGDDVRHIYFIEEGLVRYSATTTTGLRIVNTLGAGDFLGDTPLFMATGNEPITYFGWARTLERTVCSIVPLEKFYAQMHAAPKLIQLWMFNTVDRGMRTIVTSQVDTEDD